MFSRMKGLWRGYRLLRRAVAELAGIRRALEVLADAQLQVAAQAQPPASAFEPDPAGDSPYVETTQQAALMDIELRLTQARGVPPTEDEILLEFERRYGQTPAGQA